MILTIGNQLEGEKNQIGSGSIESGAFSSTITVEVYTNQVLLVTEQQLEATDHTINERVLYTNNPAFLAFLFL